MPKIIKRSVDALVPAERERVVWDDDIKGFGVRVHPTGRKVYIVKYRHEGRSVKVTIGPHGPITPAAARAKAAEIVTLAKTGRDVAGQMPRSKGSATMAELAQAAQNSWRRLDGHNQLPKLIVGVKFIDGIEAVRQQPQAAA